MVIEHLRHTFTDKSTIGTYKIGNKVWYTIEDPDRGLRQDMPLSTIQSKKIYGETCIPYGMYKVVITQSARFTRLKGRPVFTPEIIGVPGFSGIRIHPANLASQLEGCQAPGKKWVPNAVMDSRTAYKEVLECINAAIKAGEEVWIDIKKAI